MVAVAAANTVVMAPVSHLISTSAPDSNHWLSLYPWFACDRSLALAVLFVEGVVAWQRTWSGCGRSASSAVARRRKSSFVIDRDLAERQKCWSRQHLAGGTDHSLVVAFGAASGLAVGTLPLLRGRRNGRDERSTTVAVSY